MNVKVWGYLGIVVTVLGFCGWAYMAIYNAGFNAAVVEQERLIHEVKDQAAEDARVKWEGLVEAARNEIRVETEIVEVIREVEREIPIVVDRIVEITPECADLGADFAGLLNAQVRAGGGGEDDSPDVPAEPD